MKNKERILVPEDDTHKQTLTDVYKIYKTSYTKCLDSEDEMFFCDVIHQLEQNSASTLSETNSDKYSVEDEDLIKKLREIPKWTNPLPQNYGINLSVSLTCKDVQDESPLNHLENMGIETIEYVKLRIGYNYLKSNFKLPEDERIYTKSICPGLAGSIVEPIVLRMLNMKYIKSDDFLKWILRSRKKDDKKKEMKSEETQMSNYKGFGSESSAKFRETTLIPKSFLSFRDDIRNRFSIETQSEEKSRKDEVSLSYDEKQHIIMLTHYEIMDQELPDDIEIFWPGKRDLENDYINFKNALSENILHQEFIQRFKSGRFERLDDDLKLESKKYFIEMREAQIIKHADFQKVENKKKTVQCSWEKLKEQFKDYNISQEITLSLFENVVKEKTRLEDLNLCCIISKLKEIHKDDPNVGNDDEIIWRDMVVVRKKSRDSSKSIDDIIEVIDEGDGVERKTVEVEATEEVIVEVEATERETVKAEATERDIVDDDANYEVIPEYKAMIYVTKVYPQPGEGYRKDICINEAGDTLKPDLRMKEGCTGYSMKTFVQPTAPQCSFKLQTQMNDDYEQTNIFYEEENKNAEEIDESKDKEIESLSCLNPDNYVTFYTNWRKYPYSEMLDIIFHRHHQGYIFIEDKFEKEPDALKEINRIFHKSGRLGDKESSRTCINSYISDRKQQVPECCNHFGQSLDQVSSDVLPRLESVGEDRSTSKWVKKSTMKRDDFSMYDISLTDNETIEDFDYLKVENAEVERGNIYNSSTSSLETDHISDKYYYFKRFEDTQISSVTFDSHEDTTKDLKMFYDYADTSQDNNQTAYSTDDDNNSDIVDFIKNFRFGEETVKQPTNFESLNKDNMLKTNVGYVDLLEPDNCDRVKRDSDKDDDAISIDSNDSLSLRDIQSFLRIDNTIINEYQPLCTELITQVSNRDGSLASTINPTSGELLDVLLSKRKDIMSELSISYPLLYLYLTLKTNSSKIKISGNLAKFRSHLQLIQEDYDKIVHKYNLKLSENATDRNFTRYYWLHAEIFHRIRIFSEEIRFMALQYPFIRHLIIRECFQDTGTNLSYFLLQFIENDKDNLLYKNKDNMTDYQKIVHKVSQFLNEFRKSKDYKLFLCNVVVIHYTENKKFFSLENLINRDINWKKVVLSSQGLNGEMKEKDYSLNIQQQKSEIDKSITEYKYSFYWIIKQFNINFQENNLFHQYLEPDFFPKRLKDLTCDEIKENIMEDCKEWCEIHLVTELENDCNALMEQILKCEMQSIIQCYLNRDFFKNRFKHETINYFRSYFPIIVNFKEIKDEITRINEDIWNYNREYHFWIKKYSGKTRTTNKLLTRNNLFNFEKLLSKCIINSILTYYNYKVQGY